jgi:hypothetical protein
MARPLSMILMRDRGTEEGHQAVTPELIDGALIPVDLIHENSEAAIHDFVHILRVELFRHGSEASHVRKEHGDEFAFTLDGAARGKDLIRKKFRGVGARCLVVDGHGFFGLTKIVAAVGTELVPRKVFRLAFRANNNEPFPTFSTELSCLRIIHLAI